MNGCVHAHAQYALNDKPGSIIGASSAKSPRASSVTILRTKLA
jgi:hypothetical protein